MNSQPMVYSKNKPGFTFFVVNSGFTLMNNTFGEKLQEKMNEAGITAAELARRSTVTKQNIGRLLNNTPHSITGALPKVEKPTVEKLSKALNWNLDDALVSAGFAPQNAPVLPEELAIADFDGFDKNDLKDIADYINFKRMQKEKESR